MGWFKRFHDEAPNWSDTPKPKTEREKRDDRIALRVVIVVTPFIVVWILASPFVHIFWTRPAREKIKTLGYHSAAIYSQVVPCRGWFDGGFRIIYEPAPGASQFGYLCRKPFDADFTWYPK